MEPIAITGMAGRFPGAEDVDALWRLLAAGRHAIAEVPADRYGLAAWTQWREGGFVDDIFGFDAAAFGLSEAEARTMDPQQRLVLEAAYAALEDAGLRVDRVRRSRMGVFVGIGPGDYAHVTTRPAGQITGLTGAGNFLAIAANRVSYLFDLKGPSMAIDTACTSSLVAIHLACRSIAAGECSAALAGGVNAILSPELSLCAGTAGTLSRAGRVRAFDAAGDGYVRGEGVGLLVLEPLARALAEGRPVHAVITASGIGHGGAANGLAAPNRRAQEELMLEVRAAAGLSAGAIQLVEAQGTGTLIGDAMEAEAIAAAWTRERATPLLIGSVKTNLGHLETAAGVAAVIKTALAIEHATVPASLGFERQNPYVDLAARKLEVAATCRPWPDADVRRAGVHAFAVGGSLAFMILEAAPERAAGPAGRGGPELLVLSARDEAGLRTLAERWVALLGATPEAWRDLAWSAATTRRLLRHRLALVATDAATAAGALARFLAGDGAASGVVSGAERRLQVAVEFADGATIGADGASPRMQAVQAEIAACSAARGHDSGDPRVTAFAARVALAAELSAYGLAPRVYLAAPGSRGAATAAAVVMGALDVDAALAVIVGEAAAPEIEAATEATLVGRSIGLVVRVGSQPAETAGSVPVLRFAATDGASLLGSVAALLAAGVAIDPALAFSEAGRIVRVPATPWDRRNFRW